MKQSKLRKRRVWRYAVLYFLLLVVFLALVVGPIVAATNITSGTSSIFSNPKNTLYLLQPVGLNNNDTQGTNQTGTGAPGRGASQTAAASGTAGVTGKVRLF
jgi:1,3-beta-glucan synthase